MKDVLDNLKTILPPRMVREAIALYGTVEYSGSKDNPVIVQWAKETKTKEDDWYNHDSIPWCGLFMAVVAQRAGKEIPPKPLMAMSWASFGKPARVAMLGDVLVFSRKGGGHVGLYVGESSDSYYVLGGNQGNRVSITRIAKKRLHAIRRPEYNVQPYSVQAYVYNNEGELSSNEA